MIIKKKASRAPVAGGSYLAVCVYSIGIGEQLHKYADSTNYHDDVILGWELCGFTYTEDGVQKPYDVTETYTASMDERAKLRNMVEGWLGRKLSDEETEHFDTNSLVGRTASLGIVVNDKGFNRISSVQPIPDYFIQQGMPMPQPTIPFIKFDMEPWDQKAFEALPEWAQKRVMKSTEYQKIHAQVQDVQVQQPMDFQLPPQMQAMMQCASPCQVQFPGQIQASAQAPFPQAPAQAAQAPFPQAPAQAFQMPAAQPVQAPAGQGVTPAQAQAEAEFFVNPAQGQGVPF